MVVVGVGVDVDIVFVGVVVVGVDVGSSLLEAGMASVFTLLDIKPILTQCSLRLI